MKDNLVKCKTVALNGLTWDTENLVHNGKTHFMYREALNIVKASGKRLPSKKEFAKLFRLPHEWDNDKQGMWFAEHSEYLKGEKSLFLPAAGYRCGGSETIFDFCRFGYYWSATPGGTTHAYYLYFIGSLPGMTNGNRSNGLTVRCVSE